MRAKSLRRLEALEKEHHLREQQQLRSIEEALVYIWTIIHAYYLDEIKPEEGDPFDASWRALKFPSDIESIESMGEHERSSHLRNLMVDAYRRLFAKVGLDFDTAEPRVLFDALITMVNQLPDRWLDWLRSNLRDYCPHLRFAHGATLPEGLSAHNFIVYFA